MHRGCRAPQFVDMLRSVAKYAARTERRGKTVRARASIALPKRNQFITGEVTVRETYDRLCATTSWSDTRGTGPPRLPTTRRPRR